MSINAQNTQTTPCYYEPTAASQGLEQHKLRVLIDEIATLRGLTIQMSLRLMAFTAAPDDHDRVQVLDEFRTIHAQFKANMGLLFGKDIPDPEVKAHVLWIRRIVEINTDRRAILVRVEADFQSMADKLEAGRTPTFAEVRALFEQNWPVVRDKMTEVIWDLWADLDATKNEAALENVALKTTLEQTLSDIRQVSTSIRMIAINTAVLAARPQDGVEGFKFIAREVRRLAEDIDASTNNAKDAISGLL